MVLLASLLLLPPLLLLSLLLLLLLLLLLRLPSLLLYTWQGADRRDKDTCQTELRQWAQEGKARRTAFAHLRPCAAGSDCGII